MQQWRPAESMRELALKRNLPCLSAVAFVVDDGPNIQVRQNLTDTVQTAAPDADVMRMFLERFDETRLVVSRQMRLTRFGGHLPKAGAPALTLVRATR
jgi:hypothetical protein